MRENFESRATLCRPRGRPCGPTSLPDRAVKIICIWDSNIFPRPLCERLDCEPLLFLQSKKTFFSMWMSKSGRKSSVRVYSSVTREDTVVGLIGLEPMTPALSRRCSNQLSYRPLTGAGRRWWRHGDSNPRHPACKAGALPTELYPLCLRSRRRGVPSGRKRPDCALRPLHLKWTRGISIIFCLGRGPIAWSAKPRI